HEVTAPVEHGVAGDLADTADDDPGRHPLRVGIDGVKNSAGAHQAQPWASAFSVSARTSASCSAVSGWRGGRHGPPYRPTMSMDSLMAWTNSVLASQRSSGCSSRYSGTALSSSPAMLARYSSTQLRGKALVYPEIQPLAPAMANSRVASSEPISTSRPGASSE